MIRRLPAVLPLSLAACGGSALPVTSTPATNPGSAPRAVDVLTYAPGVSNDEATTIARDFVVGRHGLLAETRIDAGTCTRFDLGLADGIADADLVAYDAEGHRLAADETPGRHAAVVVCADVERAIRLYAVAARGAGETAVVARRLPREALRRLGLPDASVATGRDDAGDALRRRVVGDLGSRGFRLDAGPLTVTLEPSVPLHVGVLARAGDCVVVVARTDRSAATMELRTESGELLADDVGRDRDLGVSFCAADTRALTAVLVAGEHDHAQIVVTRGLAREVGGASSIAVGRPGRADPGAAGDRR